MEPPLIDSDSEDVPFAIAIDDGSDLIVQAATPASCAIAAQAPVPVTLITGYLGSGKTTLVRYILNERHGYRIAVILNEYGGETGLESAFVQDEQGDHANVPEWVELANGCLCCSVKAEFVQALEGLMQHAGKYEYVLVETTGLANPGPIMSELWTDEELEAAVVLDGVVTVVDGPHVSRQLLEIRPGGGGNEAQLQVALADVILLNKMDLLTEQQAAAVQAQLRNINSAAAIIPTTNSRVDLALLLNRGAYHLRLLDQLQQQQQQQPAAATTAATQPNRDEVAAAQVPLQWLKEVEAAAALAPGAGSGSTSYTAAGCSNPEHCHDHSDQEHGGGCCQVHDAAVRTIALRVAEPVQLDRFSSWVERLIWERPETPGQQHKTAEAAAMGPVAAAAPTDANSAAAGGSDNACKPEILRMKGLLHVAGSPLAHMFQAVYDLYDIVPGPDWQQLKRSKNAAAADSMDMTRVVLIGRYLDQQQLQQQLEACCVLVEGTEA